MLEYSNSLTRVSVLFLHCHRAEGNAVQSGARLIQTHTVCLLLYM